MIAFLRSCCVPVILMLGPLSCTEPKDSVDPRGSRNYYINTAGDDSHDGTQKKPWKSLTKVNQLDLNAGDTLFFRHDQIFEGTLLLDSSDHGTAETPVVITSYGPGRATIMSGDSSAIRIESSHAIVLSDLHLIGSGRQKGNIQNGLIIQNSDTVTVTGVETEGFQKSGLLVYSSSKILFERIHAHDNGFGGITVAGESKKTDNQNITIRYCNADNNPGDPTVFNNHSGNGILVGLCTNVVIEFCVATNNGWDMPRVGNGPVGIWAYEADSIVIQDCISYGNKTSKGGEDGGGFDLDGGVTNSVIQYCLSYGNEGSGFGIFQYQGASNWHHNTVRFCVSENDGLISRSRAGIFVWNGADVPSQFTDFYFYNNVIYNPNGTAIHFDQNSKRERFFYYNNILVAQDTLIKGVSAGDTFLGNAWWSLQGGFNMNGWKDWTTWTNKTGQEKKNNVLRGLNLNPDFAFEGEMVTDPSRLRSFLRYRIQQSSPLRDGGVNLRMELDVDPGPRDFNDGIPQPKGIGASF